MATKIKQQVEIKKDVVYVYRDETMTEIVGTIYKGYNIIATESNDTKDMIYSPSYGGWIKNSNVTVKKTYELQDMSVDENYIAMVPSTIENVILPGSSSASVSELASASPTDLNAIIGMPYQFSANVDRRVGNFGRKYTEKILNRDNFLYLMPGKQTFMPGASKDEVSAVFASLAEMATGQAELDPQSVIKTSSRYYGLEPDLHSYFKYVNAACRSVAILLDIGNEQVTVGGRTGKLATFDWQQALSNTIGSLFGANGSHLVIYTDGFNQISEDFGNSTRESSLVSQVNGYSDTIKEMNYIMNGSADTPLGDLLQGEGVNSTLSSIQGSINSFTGGHGVLSAILGNSTTILSGGKLVFPQLYSDSSYDRSYTVDIKLRSPEADELSLYLNIIVPYIHLMCLTAPRDFDSVYSSNGYIAPFLVKAYFRSLFNIDLGIVTSLSISKGGEGNWSSTSNLPTSMDVSLSITDLYKSMYVSPVNSIIGGDGDLGLAKFVANDAEMEQLMNLAGVNTTEINFDLKTRMLAGLAAGNVADLVRSPGNKLNEQFYKIMHNIFRVS